MDEEMFNVDPDEASNLVPEGEYVVVVHKAEKVKAKSEDGYPYIKLQLMVAEGQYNGEVVTDQLSESPKAKWRLAQLVKAAGLVKKGESGERAFTVASLKDCVLMIKVKHEEFKGMDRARPSRYWMHEMTVARLKQEAEAAGSGGGTEAAPAADPAAPEAASTTPASSGPAKAASAPAAPAAKPPAKPVKKVSV